MLSIWKCLPQVLGLSAQKKPEVGIHFTELARSALCRFDVQWNALTLLSYSSNVIFRTTGSDGPSYVLRIHTSGQVTAESIGSELRWLLAIRRDTQIRVPNPVRGVDGSFVQEVSVDGLIDSRFCVLFEWMDGETLDEELTAKEFCKIGQVMAGLHEHARHFATKEVLVPNHHSYGCGKDWERILSDPMISRRFAARAGPVFAHAEKLIKSKISELDYGREVYGLIHQDLHPGNCLFTGDEVRVIDFEGCGWGHYAYDMAVTLQYIQDYPDCHVFENAMLEGYQSIRPLPERFCESIDWFMIARILVTVSWILDDWPNSTHMAWGPKFLRKSAAQLRRLTKSIESGKAEP